MKTDDLINILSQTPQPKTPLSLKTALALVLLGSIIATLSVLGLRPDLAHITADLTALHKTILLASILWIGGWALVNSSKQKVFRCQIMQSTVQSFAIVVFHIFCYLFFRIFIVKKRVYLQTLLID